MRTAPPLTPEVAARAHTRYALVASALDTSGVDPRGTLKSKEIQSSTVAHVREQLDTAQVYLDAVGASTQDEERWISGLWMATRWSHRVKGSPKAAAADGYLQDALKQVRCELHQASELLARTASAGDAMLARHARALYRRAAALFGPGGIVAAGAHERAAQRVTALGLARVHLDAAQSHLQAAQGRGAAGVSTMRNRLAASQRLGRLPLQDESGLGSHGQDAAQDEAHRCALECTCRRLMAAAEHLRLAPRLDAELAARAQAHFSQRSALWGAVHGHSHQGSLALARNHVQAAGAHLGSADGPDRRTWSRAHSHRAALARDAQPADAGHHGDAASALTERELARLLGQPQRVHSASGTSCEHNCLSLQTAAAEMKAVAAQNPRVKDPVYHVVLSWPRGETPTDEQAFACGQHALRAVGMQDHQYVFAVHRDTAHAHLHIAVNRVHPDTFAAVYPDRDYFRLDRAMRELELQYGWKHDAGPYAVFERGGQQVIDRASKAADTKEKLPSRAADMERHAGAESLFTYARGEPKVAVLKLLSGPRPGWDNLHATLARFGLALRPKGEGLAVYDLSGECRAPIKASDMHDSLSLPRLAKQLGAYEEPSKPLLLAQQRYDRFREPASDPALREQRRQERADARRGLWQRYEEYRAGFELGCLDEAAVRQRFEDLRAASRRRRAEVRATVRDAATRKALYSVIAFEALRDRDRLRRAIRQDRQALRRNLANRRMSFREWVADQATHGDAAAINQLRGWAYAEQRERRRLAEMTNAQHVDGFRGTEAVDPVARDLGDGFTFVVLRNGAVSYRSGPGQEVFVDHGQRIEILPSALAQRHALAAAHALALQKYGPGVETTGQPAFKAAVAGLGSGRANAFTPPMGPAAMLGSLHSPVLTPDDAAAGGGAEKSQPALARRRRMR